MKVSESMKFKNILIFRAGQLGDTLISLPAFWAIRKAFPHARLTLLSGHVLGKQNYVSAQDILPKNVLFDEWLTYPTDGRLLTLLKNSLKILWQLRRKKFDAVIYMMSRHRQLKHIRRDKLIFRLAGIGHIIGTGYFEKHPLSYTEKPLPWIECEADFYLQCLKYEKIPVPSREELSCGLLLTAEEKRIAENWLKEKCGSGERENLIAIAPASKWPSKVWPEERFAEVVQRLIETKGVFPIIFGGAEDREKGERLLKIWKRGANAAGELNVRQAAAAISQCKIFIGNDSGTMHLAATAGVPCIGIFSAIDYPGRWRPFGRKNTIFRKYVECEGCLLEVCPRNNECLRRISAEEVFQASLQTLQSLSKEPII